MFQDAVTSAIQSADRAGPSASGDRGAAAVPWGDVPGLLLRRAGWIVAGVLGALLGALVLVVALPPTFTANTQLVVQPTDLKAVDGSVTQQSNQPDSSVALVETAARVLGSQRVLGQVVDTLGLARDPEFARTPSRARAVLAEVRRLLGIDAAVPADDPAADAVQRLAKAIAIRRSERTFVIDLSVRSNDPTKSVRIANAIVAAFLDIQAEARANASRRISEALTARLGALRADLRRNEDAVQAFKVANNLVVANGQLVNEQQLSEASSQLLAAENRTADAKAKLDQLEAARGDPGAIPESLQSQTITALRSQLAQVGKQEADARATFGARHPQLAQIRSQVEAVRRALDGEVQRIRDAARGEYDRARSGEAGLRANLARQQARGNTADAAQIRLRELQRDAEASRGIYEAFLVRARETAEQEQVDTLNAWVMSPATPPTDRSFPPPNLVIAAAALALGLGAGLALALLRERLDPRLWTAGGMVAATGVPVIATVAATRRGTSAATPGEGGMAELVADLTAGRSASAGRIVLLLGQRGAADAGRAAAALAAAAVAEGCAATVMRFDTDAPVTGPAGGTEAPGRSMTVREPREPGEVPLLVERLKGHLARAGGGLLIVPARRGTVAVPQLVTLADASALVSVRARTTRHEARALAQRLRSKAGALRGAILLPQE